LKDEVNLREGSILYTAYSSISTMELNKKIAAVIAIGVPVDNSSIGVIMEYSHYGELNVAKDTVRKMVKLAMSERGISIKEILLDGIEAVNNKEGYTTAFAGVSLW
jgi:pyruvoyl-dependent arginine decarboxylase